MLKPFLRDSGMKNINQKIHNVLKLFLVKHCHDTLNGWLKTLRKHGVMLSLGSGMNITHTFSILWPCFHQKNSKHQEMFCHWMLENIDQTFQMSIQWSSHRIVKEVGIVGSMLYRNHCENILNTKEVKAPKHLKQRQNVL